MCSFARCSLARLMTLRVLVLVLMTCLFLTEGMGVQGLACPGAGECPKQQRLQKLKVFSKGSVALEGSEQSNVGLKEVRQFLAQKLDILKTDLENAIELIKKPQSPREGRQYYATGGEYGTGYPGYTYGTGSESSTTFNGLDAALSALAFLAFGVWLFNLVLPQLQVAGLGVPGIGRRTGQLDSSSRGTGDDSVLSKILTSDQDLVNLLFPEGNKSATETFERIVGNILPSSFLKIVTNATYEYGKALWEAFQEALELRKEAPEEKKDKVVGKRSLAKKDWRNPWTTHRWKPENEPNGRGLLEDSLKQAWKLESKFKGGELPELLERIWKLKSQLKGRGLLEDLLGQVWNPIRFIVNLLSQHNTDHEFPNSRTEPENGNIDRWNGELHQIADNSLGDSWNGKRNSLDADPLHNSLGHRERHRYHIDLV